MAQTGLILQQKVEGFMCHSEGKLNRTRLSREASRMGAVCLLAHRVDVTSMIRNHTEKLLCTKVIRSVWETEFASSIVA